MPGAQGNRSLATLTSVANLLTGQVYETIPYDAFIEVGLTQSATGMIMSIACDSDIVVQDVGETNIPIKSTPPAYPDEFMPGFYCTAGSKLYLAVRNPTGGTLTLFYNVRITQV
jgi:hypothetical protein